MGSNSSEQLNLLFESAGITPSVNLSKKEWTLLTVTVIVIVILKTFELMIRCFLRCFVIKRLKVFQ